MQPTDTLARTCEAYASPEELAAGIVASFVGKNAISPAEVPSLFISVRNAIAGNESASPDAEAIKPTRAEIKRSVTEAAITSFIDGRPYQTLKRHLTRHGLTPEGYRVRYGLPADYPMVAPGYSVRRSALAKDAGLGQQNRKPADA